MNIEELKKYRDELIKTHEKKYVLVSINYDKDEEDITKLFKIEGKPITKKEIVNSVNTEEGVKEFESTMKDIVDKSGDLNYVFDEIELYFKPKFYCEVAHLDELILNYKYLKTNNCNYTIQKKLDDEFTN
ncbi:MAG: hypothetical protein IKP76_03675 [Bacilli bacterium]|nr:hypothetical protein [Bacilli bacterium]